MGINKGHDPNSVRICPTVCVAVDAPMHGPVGVLRYLFSARHTDQVTRRRYGAHTNGDHARAKMLHGQVRELLDILVLIALAEVLVIRPFWSSYS